MTARYVVLGLARPRTPWFSDISRWATTAAIPVEFVKCLSADEARARLASGRRWSAVLVDAGAHGVDRDLLDVVAASGAVALVVADRRVERDWVELGARSVLPHDLGRDDLLGALAVHARAVDRATPRPDASQVTTPPPWRGSLVVVLGSGGTGSSTLAAWTAQGLGSDVRDHGLVVLADLCLDADQAVLHDAGQVAPGLPELVDAHRLGRPDPDDVRAMTVPGGRERAYDLLVGVRRHRDWTLLRPRAIAATLDGLRAAYRTVVADVDADLEGEAETGSPDVEERNALARNAVGSADVVLAVGRGDVVGVHRLASTIRDLRRFGVPLEHLLPVVNRAPRSPARRAGITRALATLALDDAEVVIPLFVGERRHLDDVVRDARAWPSGPSRELAAAVHEILARASDSADSPEAGGPQRIEPGSLGSYIDLESDAS